MASLFICMALLYNKHSHNAAAHKYTITTYLFIHSFFGGPFFFASRVTPWVEMKLQSPVRPVRVAELDNKADFEVDFSYL